MDTKIAKETLKVIREERKGQLAKLPDHQDAAYDQWLFYVEPFVNDLCLMLLVAIRHQVERELLSLAARVTNDGKTITTERYRERVQEIRSLKKGCWPEISKTLGLPSFPDWNGSMKTLQLLANCYKHEPSQGPEKKLLKHLGLDQTREYAPLPESGCFREGLALYLKLDKNTDYCDIAEELLKQADGFLASVQQQPNIRKVKWAPVSLHPKDFLC